MNIERLFPNIQRLSSRAQCLKKAKLFGGAALIWLAVSCLSWLSRHHAPVIALAVAFFVLSILYALKGYALYSRSRRLDRELF